MPNTLIFSSTSTTGYLFGSTTTGTMAPGFTVMPGIVVSNGNSTVFSDDPANLLVNLSTSLQIFGSVVSGSANAISTASSARIIIGSTGLVASANGGGVLISSTASSVFPAHLINDGSILGGSFGASLVGAFCGVINRGAINGGSSGVYLSGLGATLTNSGTISAANMARPGTLGVQFDSSQGAHLDNSGLIEAIGSSDAAAVIAFGVGGDTKITNEGILRSPTGWGIVAFTKAEVVNSGTIQGNYGFTGSVSLGGPNSSLVNTGTMIGDAVVMGRVENRGGFIDGDVVLLGASTLFDGRGGTVSGAVYGGVGDSLYRTDGKDRIGEVSFTGSDTIESAGDFDLNPTGQVEYLVLTGAARTGIGNTLDNGIFGNIQANRLEGGAGNDTLDGLLGNDTLLGDAGTDLMYGSAGDDSLRGGALHDTLAGGDGDDTLLGDNGNDRLTGDDGQDQLIGGQGRDVLTGGEEADSYVFRTALDSAPGSTLRDIIVGFEPGLDLIDLTRIDANRLLTGNQVFAFIGTAGFGSIAGQLRAVHAANSVLQGDVDGNGSADFELQLNGIASISVNDILL